MEDGLPAARIFELLSRIAFSLAAVHSAGVVHRDLKPDNIILRGGDAPVLIDFGIALLKSNSGERGIGTPAYMAPEQASGHRIDARADLYALGVIAYEMLAGARPERRNRRRTRDTLVQKGVDPAIVRLISRLLMYRLWRPRSASEVGALFAQASALPTK
jgi:serine/threonine protein kinase